MATAEYYGVLLRNGGFIAPTFSKEPSCDGRTLPTDLKQNGIDRLQWGTQKFELGQAHHQFDPFIGTGAGSHDRSLVQHKLGCPSCACIKSPLATPVFTLALDIKFAYGVCGTDYEFYMYIQPKCKAYAYKHITVQTPCILKLGAHEPRAA
ncbi:hypothetical protein BO71DRAFT_427046 [Aspergillus ellipticus CBS 707.79]|uniref:Uncharacterized protein n=1 Tax=Aspergillus ellipticus CBS 707.79 TaxID=1448320 RepID=A0A319E9Q8_9EURO|nr:hypothetical protein BO71DRAFT_427046 [Aspergillus ellipticus CBS 707.79]